MPKSAALVTGPRCNLNIPYGGGRWKPSCCRPCGNWTRWIYATPIRVLPTTPAQVALAWLLHQGEDVIPIPGTRRSERIEENAGAVELKLSADPLAQIDTIAPPGLAEGATLV